MSIRFVAAALVSLSLRIVGASELKRFVVYSDPIFLRPGEVHNRYVLPKALPQEIVQKFANKTMHMKSAQLDIVLVNNETGEKSPAPLYMTYNHHHALMLGPHEDLMKLYNYTKDHDPLDPTSFPNQTKKHHMHRGCMMKRRSFEALLTAALPQGRRSQVAAFGGASGAEYRGTSTKLAGRYTYAVDSPDSFMVLMHFINTYGAPESQKLWECPCTSARKIDVKNGTIDGQKPIPFSCSQQLIDEKNTACSLATYEGGYRCCEHGVFLTEGPHPAGPLQQIEAKFTFEFYEPDAPEVKTARPTMQPSCCDATGGYLSNSSYFANLEYDIPQCSPGTPPEQCEHVISSVEYFDVPSSNSSDPNEEFELVHAWGHQHVGGNGLELYKDSTGELLCRSHPKYGTGEQAGDEKGFVVGIPPCVWGPPPLPAPPRFRRHDHVRTVARYNSTEHHHGVMSLWLLTAAPVNSPSTRAEVLI